MNSHFHFALLMLLLTFNFILAWSIVKLIIVLRKMLHDRKCKQFNDSLKDFDLEDNDGVLQSLAMSAEENGSKI